MARCIGTWWNEQWNDEMNNEIMKWTKEWWNDETLEGLSKSVKHTNWPSAFTYDKMNIHVNGWVIIKTKCVKVNECVDNMIRG